MARPLPAGSVELGSDFDGKGAEMFTDDLTSALAEERIAELRRQADAARLALAARRARRRRPAARATAPAATARPMADGGSARREREPAVLAGRHGGE